MSEAIAFYTLAVLSVGTALAVILARRAITAVLSLVALMFALAGVFVLCQAYFIAAIQVIVYAGAVMVLFLFVVMLLNLEDEALSGVKVWLPRAFAGGVALLFLAQWRWGAQGIKGMAIPDTVATRVGSIQAVGQLLFTEYLVPFEVASLLILSAIVGVVILAKKEK